MKIMTALHQYISAIGSFQGVLLFVLLVCDRNTTAASKVLGLFCLSMGLAFFLPFITFGVASEVFNPMAAWLFFLPVMYGSLLYLYCSKVIFNVPFKSADLFHILPLFACYALNFDVLFVQHEEFRRWIVGAAAPTQRLWFSEYILFGVAIAYLLSTAFLIKRYHRQASDTLSNFNPTIFLWLGVLVSSFIVIFLVKGVMAFTNFATMNMLIFSDALIVLIILLIALTQWKNPQFFVVNRHGGDEQALISGSVPQSAISIGSLDEDIRAAMFDELTKHIEQEHSYRNCELSLAKLADSIGMSPHHLSEVLNQHAGQNFNHFINAYRVEEVCEKLHSSSALKVLDIAMQAGFSSKSTFNTIFKKFIGVTPTQYRQSYGNDVRSKMLL
jgi:AraC-like DNA-binding protein